MGEGESGSITIDPLSPSLCPSLCLCLCLCVSLFTSRQVNQPTPLPHPAPPPRSLTSLSPSTSPSAADELPPHRRPRLRGEAFPPGPRIPTSLPLFLSPSALTFFFSSLILLPHLSSNRGWSTPLRTTRNWRASSGPRGDLFSPLSLSLGRRVETPFLHSPSSYLYLALPYHPSATLSPWRAEVTPPSLPFLSWKWRVSTGRRRNVCSCCHADVEVTLTVYPPPLGSLSRSRWCGRNS